MRKLALILSAAAFLVTGSALAATKPDPKWKNNSMAKKQAECKADPTLPKCKKKPQDKKK